MRVYIDIPAPFLAKLREQAQAAHRPPRYHLEWLIRQALQERFVDERPCPPVRMVEEERP